MARQLQISGPMVWRSLLGSVVLVAIAPLWGCLEMDRAPGEPDELTNWQMAEPAPWEGAGAAEAAEPLEPDERDVAFCDAMAARAERCTPDRDGAGAMDLESCQDRYACSRRLWRTDVEAVYRCSARRPCDDPDPVMSCLDEVGRTLHPSAAELAFGQAREQAEGECGPLVEVAPRQADAIYEGLSFCLLENDDCEVKAACAEMMVRAIVDRACGAD